MEANCDNPSPADIDRLTRRKKHFHYKHRVAQEFKNAGLEELSHAIDECEEVQQLVLCTHCASAWYVPKFCRKRVCPLCSWKLAKERSYYIKLMTHGMKFPKMITLTMPTWTTNPRDGISYIRDAFSRLRRTKLFKNCKGGAYQIELKQKPNGWHIHIHAIIDAPFIPYQHIFSAWKTEIGHDCPQIQITAAGNDKMKEYVCKYVAKAGGFEHDLTGIVAWYKATRGIRLFGTFGEWFNATIEEMEDEDTPARPGPVCPFCGAVNTTYPARAGPAIYGYDDWQFFRDNFLRGVLYERPILWIKEMVRPAKAPARISEPILDQIGLEEGTAMAI